MKIYVSADIEGVAGVTSFQQLAPEGFEYREARAWMTGEVAAALEGARAAGATEYVVSDSHGNGQNLLLDALPPGTQVVRSWPRPLAMMQGLEDGGFACALLVGHHAGHTDRAGVLAHTEAGAIYELRLNGEAASETRLNAAIAGHFGVPVVLITGDAAYVESTRRFLPRAEAVVTKHAYGDYSVRTLLPDAARDAIRAASERAVRRRDEVPLYRLDEPVTVEIQFKQRLPAEVLALLPEVERAGATGVRYVAADILQANRFVVFATNYKPDLR